MGNITYVVISDDDHWVMTIKMITNKNDDKWMNLFERPACLTKLQWL